VPESVRPRAGDAGPKLKGRTKRLPFSESATTTQTQWSVADGRDALGVVVLVDGTFTAIGVDGTVHGAFGSLREASRAFRGERRGRR
jgi:hypothetical protein